MLGVVFSLGVISVFAVLALFVLVLETVHLGRIVQQGMVRLGDGRAAGAAGDGIVRRMDIRAADGRYIA